jgi:hypothetical protein
MEESLFDSIDRDLFFINLKIAGAVLSEIYKEELGEEFVEQLREKLEEYRRKAYDDYQKELQEAYNKLPKRHAGGLDILLWEIGKWDPCKDKSTCLSPSDLLNIQQSIFIYRFKTSIIRSISKHAERNEIEKIEYALTDLLTPPAYELLLVTHMLKAHIVSYTYKNPLYDKMIEQIKHAKASNDTQKYMEAIQNYVQKDVETIDLIYQDSSKYIEDIVEELFSMNKEGFVKKIKNVLDEHKKLLDEHKEFENVLDDYKKFAEKIANALYEYSINHS